LILLLPFVARTRAEEFPDTRVDDVLDRAAKAHSLTYVNLDSTTLTKSARLARPNVNAAAFNSGGLHRPDGVARGPQRGFDQQLPQRHNEAGKYMAAALIAEETRAAAQSAEIKRPTFGGVQIGFQPERSAEEVKRSLEVQRALARSLQAPLMDPLSTTNEDTSTNVVEIHSESELEQHSSGLTILEVTSKACRACKAFVPKYKRLAAEFHGQVRFLKVVGNENEYTHRLVTQRLRVKATPTFYFMRNGEVVSDLRGGNEEKIRSALLGCLRPERATANLTLSDVSPAI
jgi:thiol-disulfide isomerase/thioredoxin